jgi:hypothetical protein
MGLQECISKHTSSEFMDWLIVMEDEEWYTTTRTDYYLAQIASEIRRFMEAFSKNPKAVGPKDLLFTFERGDGEERSAKESIVQVQEEEVIDTRGRRPVNGGEEAMSDPKWRKVNQNAKAVWAARMGIKPSEGE